MQNYFTNTQITENLFWLQLVSNIHHPSTKELLDRALLLRFPAPRSFTGYSFHLSWHFSTRSSCLEHSRSHCSWTTSHVAHVCLDVHQYNTRVLHLTVYTFVYVSKHCICQKHCHQPLASSREAVTCRFVPDMRSFCALQSPSPLTAVLMPSNGARVLQ